MSKIKPISHEVQHEAGAQTISTQKNTERFTKKTINLLVFSNLMAYCLRNKRWNGQTESQS